MLGIDVVGFFFKFALILICFLLWFLVGKIKSSSSLNSQILTSENGMKRHHLKSSTKCKNGNNYVKRCTFLAPTGFNGSSV